MIKNVLIAGATGFIGSHLVEKLIDEKLNVFILKRSFDNTDRLKRFTDNITFFDLDKDGLEKAFAKKVDLVINLVTDFGRSEDSKQSSQVDTNIVFALKLLETAADSGVEYYFTMDSALSPDVNLYAYTKKALKEILKLYFDKEIKIFNLRLEYVYGENDDLNKFIPMAITTLKNDEELNMSLGLQDLDFVYVKDCVSAISHIIKNVSQFDQNFNDLQIGTGKTTKLRDFIEIIRKETESNSVVNYGAKPYREHEQMYSKADISTLKGWQPQYNLKETVKLLIK